MNNLLLEKDIRLKEKDKIVEEKDILLNEIIREKDIRLIEITREKDIRLKEKDKIVEEKDIRLKEKEAQILGAKGLLTSRGIFERKLSFCLDELKRLGLANKNQSDNITGIIVKMMKEKNKLPVASKCYELIHEASKCECDLKTLYGTLSHSIHGNPWYGPSVKIHMTELKPQESCLMIYIANDMSLTFE